MRLDLLWHYRKLAFFRFHSPTQSLCVSISVLPTNVWWLCVTQAHLAREVLFSRCDGANVLRRLERRASRPRRRLRRSRPVVSSTSTLATQAPMASPANLVKRACCHQASWSHRSANMLARAPNARKPRNGNRSTQVERAHTHTQICVRAHFRSSAVCFRAQVVVRVGSDALYL